MKKISMTALVLLVVFASLYGQDAGKFTVGARGGMNIVAGKISDDFKYQLSNNNCKEAAMPGGIIALCGSYGFTNMFALQTELDFMIAQGKGGRDKENSSTYINISYSSLDIPLLLKVNFLSSQSRFGILAGPYFTVPLGKAKTKYEGGFTNPDEENAVGAPDFGITFGLYGGFKFTKTRLVFDLRYVHDFGDVTIKKWLPGDNDLKYLERRAIAITCGLEYTF